ncbi:hypothetical protein BHQ18_12355 [Mycolicibacterium flavescens]|uniref:Uncharacterized protein n=1 Tax=Mycolicibacterium flavescens TaxID=1776 RepID=A0A1E3RK01_MYCFV|nr:hypothetical protein BHQ18_12355 [Mycolicibacterium flavescens]
MSGEWQFRLQVQVLIDVQVSFLAGVAEFMIRPGLNGLPAFSRSTVIVAGSCEWLFDRSKKA